MFESTLGTLSRCGLGGVSNTGRTGIRSVGVPAFDLKCDPKYLARKDHRQFYKGGPRMAPPCTGRGFRDLEDFEKTAEPKPRKPHARADDDLEHSSGPSIQYISIVVVHRQYAVRTSPIFHLPSSKARRMFNKLRNFACTAVHDISGSLAGLVTPE